MTTRPIKDSAVAREAREARTASGDSDAGAGAGAPAVIGLGAPPVPSAFNDKYLLDTDSDGQHKWRKAWKWAIGGGGSSRTLCLLAAPDAPYSSPQTRSQAPSTAAVEAVVAYLDPATTKRYAPIRDRDGNVTMTFCNIFVNDATRVLCCEIPNDPANTVVAQMRVWLEQSGAAAGWTKTTNGQAAQDHVNNGHVAIMMWSKGTFSDHVALVRPGTGEARSGAFWPRIAQAGLIVSNDVSSFATFSHVWALDNAALAFYLHD